MIGIDPGLTGAIAIVSGDRAEVFDLPTITNGKGKAKVKRQINAAGLREIFSRFPRETVFIERISAMPGQGVASMFSMGDSFGCIRGVAATLDFPIEFITPQSWKKHYRLTSDKEQARAKAVELFPALDLHRKKDHNRAEALLIARYGELLQ